MLKSIVDGRIHLVTQPDHAQISGALAAHWGGANGFAMPGQFDGAHRPRAWRNEVVLAIAEHDNGWWEWEAMPTISPHDGLPIGLGEASRTPDPTERARWRAEGFDRWRRGVGRLSERHPYAALLVSMHAYWLYAVAFDDLRGTYGDTLRHPLFGDEDVVRDLDDDAPAVRSFLEDLATIQQGLRKRTAADERMAGAERGRHLFANARLVQHLDALSLVIGLHDMDDHIVRDVPRASWDDRISMVWTRRGRSTIVIQPYPFIIDPLPVSMPARIVEAEASRRPAHARNGLAGLHGARRGMIEVTLSSE